MLKTQLIVSSLAALLLGAAPVGAQTTTPNAAPARPIDLVCMQTAIRGRDNVLVKALADFSGSVKTALETRRDALVAAFGLTETEARKKAQRSVWETYKKTVRGAKKNLKDQRQQAWRKFQSDRKTCGGQREDVSHPGLDELI